jgi:indolepyruvate ferredoxin oxidoreductase
VVRRAEGAERGLMPGSSAFAEVAAKNLFKLMAYKDECEVARLYTDGAFLKNLHRRFEGDFTLEFHLAPPLLAERDPRAGHLKKRRCGSWMLRVFAVLAELKFLRGTMLDPFGRSEERRLIAEYEAPIDELGAGLAPDNHGLAVLPEQFGGFGHVKPANLAAARAKQATLLAAFRSPPPPQAIAAE